MGNGPVDPGSIRRPSPEVFWRTGRAVQKGNGYEDVGRRCRRLAGSGRHLDASQGQ